MHHYYGHDAMQVRDISVAATAVGQLPVPKSKEHVRVQAHNLSERSTHVGRKDRAVEPLTRSAGRSSLPCGVYGRNPELCGRHATRLTN